MSFPSQLVSPNGVTVTVGSAREHLTLRSQGYKTPEQVTAAAAAAVASAEAAVAEAESKTDAANAKSAEAQTDLDSARENAATNLAGLKDELGDGGDPAAPLGGDPVAPKPLTGRTARTK
ncbi:hypothetical protein [Rhodococcus erythropolis]|uniref:hypothetical protein n=1 Tax=Rhodococcus erythropolis TaxID=1833 RepID=UPI000879056F|nr:hypothetical protein [Rhodococcus erythropolis]OFV79243.1 hypothetical protein RERY_02490 [Rhodococcus erythropolis]